MGFELKDAHGYLTQVGAVLQAHKGRAVAVGMTRREGGDKVLGFIAIGHGTVENFTVPGTHAMLYLEAARLRAVAKMLAKLAVELEDVGRLASAAEEERQEVKR